MTARPAMIVPTILAYTPRERSRALVRTAFSRRRGRVVPVRTPAELESAMTRHLVDAVLVDLGGNTDECWKAAAYAREYPSAPFFGVVPMRAADGPSLARAVELEFADILVEGIDDNAARDLVWPATFSARFAAALDEPPPQLNLTNERQVAVWRAVVAHAGRPVRTAPLARVIGISREHLSRAFASGGAPNLKRVIDLVRLIAAAELAKNPGYDVRDVATVLEFASSSHLSTSAQRVVGTRPASLPRLRAIDLIQRFAQGRARSRR
jgi:AraC-like DNA-binding protein